MKCGWLFGALASAVVMPLITVQACGPDFSPDVFVLKLRPDRPREFAAGKFGVLLPTYPRLDLAVAFRYLHGGVLSAAEQQAYQPTYSYTDPEWEKQWKDENAANNDDPAQTWQVLRARYAAPAAKLEKNRTETVKAADGQAIQSDFENCAANAFETASATLGARAKTWGERSPELADWLSGQDAVFANCGHGALQLPHSAPAGAPALLLADRSYQSAAARFYGLQFGDARNGFEAIGKDANSPWRGIARYMAARCLVREAFFARGVRDNSDQANFDFARMKQAAVLLESMLREKDLPGISRGAIQRELDFVRLRSEPEARLRELSAALAGPKQDPSYRQHLVDLTWALNVRLDQLPVREDADPEAVAGGLEPDNGTLPADSQPAAGFSKTYQDLAALRATSSLVDWLITFQSPAAEARGHALAEWKRTNEMPWLVAAIVKEPGQGPDAASLVSAAEAAAADSPAWETLTYHRVRLLIALHRAQEARTLLAQALPRIEASGRISSINLFQGLRMRSAASVNEALALAPRKIIARSSQEQSSLLECREVMKDPKRVYDCRRDDSAMALDADAAAFFNLEAPLATLVEAAHSEALPADLRRSLAMMAWVRSVLLNNAADAAKLLPLLPDKVRAQAGSGTGFRPLMTILRNPGLRPYLDPGVQRSDSYDFVESYGDNWWCGDWALNDSNQRGEARGSSRVASPMNAAILTDADVASAKRESEELKRQGIAEEDLGNRVLAYAKEQPNDPDLPEALYLSLRLIRYGCDHAVGSDTVESKQREQRIDAIRKAAARILRQRFAASPWTKKAAPLA